MTTTINDRTPEKMKAWLRCCGTDRCEDCPYKNECDSDDTSFIAPMLLDLLLYIERLEFEHDEAHRSFGAMLRERDAAVEDLEAHRPCDACGFYELQGDGCMRCRRHTERPMWKWRGVEVE